MEQDNRCWYVVLLKENYEKISKALKDYAVLHAGELTKYFFEEKANAHVTISRPAEETPVDNKKSPKTTNLKLLTSLSEENREIFTEYKNVLLLKGYSPSTIRTYCNEFHIFIETLKNVPAKELTPAQLQRYLLFCVNKLKLSENTVHSRINALKFFYEQVLHKEKMFFDIPRPKKPHQSPQVFSQDEVAAIINSVQNKKHKVIII